MNLKKRMLQAIKNKIWKMRGGPARLRIEMIRLRI